MQIPGQILGVEHRAINQDDNNATIMMASEAETGKDDEKKHTKTDHLAGAGRHHADIKNDCIHQCTRSADPIGPEFAV